MPRLVYGVLTLALLFARVGSASCFRSLGAIFSSAAAPRPPLEERYPTVFQPNSRPEDVFTLPDLETNHRDAWRDLSSGADARRVLPEVSAVRLADGRGLIVDRGSLGRVAHWDLSGRGDSWRPIAAPATLVRMLDAATRERFIESLRDPMALDFRTLSLDTLRASLRRGYSARPGEFGGTPSFVIEHDGKAVCYLLPRRRREISVVLPFEAPIDVRTATLATLPSGAAEVFVEQIPHLGFRLMGAQPFHPELSWGNSLVRDRELDRKVELASAMRNEESYSTFHPATGELILSSGPSHLPEVRSGERPFRERVANAATVLGAATVVTAGLLSGHVRETNDYVVLGGLASFGAPLGRALGELVGILSWPIYRARFRTPALWREVFAAETLAGNRRWVERFRSAPEEIAAPSRLYRPKTPALAEYWRRENLGMTERERRTVLAMIEHAETSGADRDALRELAMRLEEARSDYPRAIEAGKAWFVSRGERFALADTHAPPASRLRFTPPPGPLLDYWNAERPAMTPPEQAAVLALLFRAYSSEIGTRAPELVTVLLAEKSDYGQALAKGKEWLEAHFPLPSQPLAAEVRAAFR